MNKHWKVLLVCDWRLAFGIGHQKWGGFTGACIYFGPWLLIVGRQGKSLADALFDAVPDEDKVGVKR